MKHFTALALLITAAVSAAFSAEPAAFTSKVTGHGRPMILIPGLSCPGAVWDSSVQHFQGDYECHVLSLAGFAGVPAKPGAFIEPEVEAIAAYIRDHHLEHPVVVGHSLGGFLALDIAAKYPGLTGPLVIVDAYPFLAALRQPNIDTAGARAAADGMRVMFSSLDDTAYAATVKSGRTTRSLVTGDTDHEQVIGWSLASDRTATLNAMAEMYATDLRPDLAKIKAPTLVMATWAAYSQYIDRAGMEAVARDQYAQLAGVNVVLHDSARHFIMMDDPAWLFGQIDTFLAASSTAPSHP